MLAPDGGSQQGGTGKVAERETQAGEMKREKQKLDDQGSRQGIWRLVGSSPEHDQEHVEEQGSNQGGLRSHQHHKEKGKNDTNYASDIGIT